MKLNRKEAEFLQDAIERWRQQGLLSDEQARQLEASLEVSALDWKNIAQIAFVASIVCAIIAFVIVLKQDLLVKLFYRLINAPYSVLSLLFALLSAGLFLWGYRLKRNRPARRFTNEMILLAGGVFAGAAIAFFGQAIDQGNHHFAPLVLLAAALYLSLGRLLPSMTLWLTGIIALGVWFAAETAYVTDYDPCWLGMNYPLRFVPFGLLLFASSRGLQRFDWPPPYFETVAFLGLLTFFTSLWLVTIFGNYGDWDLWRAAGWEEFALYALILAAVSALAVWQGALRNDQLLRGFGIIFFLLNLYTKFFEHAWDHLHRALFFALLAASFWFIGRRAERIWYFDPT